MVLFLDHCINGPRGLNACIAELWLAPLVPGRMPLVAFGDERAIVAPGSANHLQGLRDVTAMHREGLLDAEEFKAAKRALLGL